MIHLLTHDDLDGLGCEFIAKEVFPGVHVTNCNYVNSHDGLGKVLEAKPDILIIADIWFTGGLTQGEHNELAAFQGKLYIFDHHETSEEEQRELVKYGHTVVTGEGVSATTKMAEYFNIWYPSVELIDKYDNSGTYEGMAGALNLLFWEIPAEDMLPVLKRNPFCFDSKEQHILDSIKNLHEDYYSSIKNDVIPITGANGKTYAFLKASSYKTYVFHKLRKEYDAAIILDTAKEPYQANFRSSGEVSVNHIAKAFGGGGHPFAAGCSIPNNDIAKFCVDVSKIIKEGNV